MAHRPNGPVLMVCLTVAWIALGAARSGAQDASMADSWDTSRAPLPAARSLHAAASAGGFLWVFGGEDDVSETWWAHALLRYDPVTDSWQARAAIPSYEGQSPVGWRECAGVEFGGNLYQFGGTVVWPGLAFIDNSAWRYDVAADRWTPLNRMPLYLHFPRATVDGGRAYVVGERFVDGGNAVTSYDFATGQWQTYSRILYPALRSAFLGSYDGRLYLAGGRNGPSPSRWTFRFDPGQNEWTQMADMPVAKWGGASAEVNGRMYVVGGRPLPYDTMLEYSMAVNRWTVRAALPAGGAFQAAAAWLGPPSSAIHFIGGQNNDGYLDRHHRYHQPDFPHPDDPRDLFMRTPGGTPLQEGDILPGTAIVLGAIVDGPAGSLARLEVEVVPEGTGFTGLPNAVGSFSPPGMATITFSQVSEEGSWTWRCRAMSDEGEPNSQGWIEFGSASPDFIVDRTAPTTPVGLEPNSYVEVRDPAGGTIHFTWTPASDNLALPLTYEVQVAFDAAFAQPVGSATVSGQTSCTMPLGPRRESYYWRVRSEDASGNTSGQWSGPLPFHVYYNDGTSHAAGDAAKWCGFSGAGSRVGAGLLVLLLMAAGGLALILRALAPAPFRSDALGRSMSISRRSLARARAGLKSFLEKHAPK